MKNIIFVSLLLFLLGCGNSTDGPEVQAEALVKSKETNRPNIIMILCDDLGYSDVGFNGATDIITPNLDQLAAGGTVCTDGYVAHPFCGPSRAGLLTGRYPHTFGSQFNLMMNSGELIGTGIPREETFMSTVIKAAGYRTGIIGKWHLGAVPGYHPNERGFDDFYGFLGGGHRYFPEEYQPIYEQQLKNGNELINDYLKPLEHNGKEVRETEYITDALSREAVRFVGENSQQQAPFFLHLAYNAPHSPLEAKAEDLALFSKIENKKRRTYAAMVYAVDRGIGAMVEQLKKTDQLDNTLIVFFSDNGGKLTLGATNKPLRAGKGSTCEGGFRVPMLFHWSGKIPAGQKFQHPVSALDFYPTFVHLAKGEIPEGKKLDGKNIWEYLTTGQNPREEENIYALRHREGYSDVGVRRNQWKALKIKQKKWSLYNLRKDISEQHDVSSEHPEQLKKMVAEAEKWSQTHTEPRWFDPVELEKDWKEKKMGKFSQTFEVDY